MHDSTSLLIVRSWQDAVNSGDTDRVVELSDPDIEIAGPRGSGHGHQLLRDWMGRAGITLDTLRLFGRGDIVVVEQRGVWRSMETGEPMGEQIVASCFTVRDGRVIRVARHDSLDGALAEAGLEMSDEVPGE